VFHVEFHEARHFPLADAHHVVSAPPRSIFTVPSGSGTQRREHRIVVIYNNRHYGLNRSGVKGHGCGHENREEERLSAFADDQSRADETEGGFPEATGEWSGSVLTDPRSVYW
jgi:hypothetical protein